MKLILGSTSRFRAAQLQRLTYEFSICDSEVDEDVYKSEKVSPAEICQILSRKKAEAVAQKFPDDIVIGADQLVDFKGEVLGKPHTFENAVNQLMKMRGAEQILYTGMCVITPQKTYEHLDKTVLTMRDLSEAQIRSYIKHDDPLKCAGSCQIDKTGLMLFNKIDSEDFTSITGLPLITLSEILSENGIQPHCLSMN